MSLVRKTEPTLVNDINPLGQEGWELVTVMHTQDKKGEPCWIAFLKRPSSGAPKAAPLETSAAAAKPSGPSGARHAVNPPGFDLDGETFDIKKEE
jgi:hypothetical protein